MSTFHGFEMDSITGEPVRFSDYDGRVCLVVNVASACGLTPQYAGLRALHDEHEGRGLTVMGFPCNQFGRQEPGTNDEVLEFATTKYEVTFPMFAKIEVNGEGAAPLYRFLCEAAPNEDGTTAIPWNFTKFLVGRDGTVLRRYEPKVTPEQIAEDLAELL